MSAIADVAVTATQVHGFVDVLESRGKWPIADDGEGSSYLTGRRKLPLPDGPVTVESHILCTGGSGQTVLPGDEFVLILRGQMRFRQKGQEFQIGARDAAVFLANQPLEWSADETAELIIMRCTAGGSGQQPVKIDTSAALSPSNPPLADLLIGPTPACRSHSDYRSVTGEFSCGTWDSSPYHRRLMAFRHFELMRLLEGEVTFVDQNGSSGTFGAGDVVLFVQGGGASWESHSHVKKIFATFRPAQ